MNQNKNLITVPTTITLPVSLVDRLYEVYHTENSSEAINNGLLDCLSVSSYRERMDDFALHQILSIEQRILTRSYSIRISAALKILIENQYQGENSFSGTVTNMLANSLYFSGEVSASPLMHLLRIPGSKWDQAMQAAIRHIFETSSKIWATSIEPCAGALGIFANFRVAFNEIINDKDLRKVNLCRVLKENADELLLKMLCLDANEATFKELKKEDKDLAEKCKDDNRNHLDKHLADISAAARFLFLNLMSVRNDGYIFKRFASYRKTMDAIRPLHERLEKTRICAMDILALVRKHKKDRNIIFIIDPPYLDTDIYADKLVTDDPKGKTVFGDKEHKELAKLLRETNRTYGNDFIYFCRITSTRRKDSHGKPAISKKELIENDRHMLGRIEDMFWGYGFYYMDVLFNKTDGTTERIITSFPFEGATLYGKERV